MDILNCDAKEACSLLKKIGKEVSNEFTKILRTADFCAHMGIDEMLIQLFLASLNEEEPLPPAKRLPALTREELATERPRKIQDVIDDLRDGIMENTLTLQLRGKLWEEENPMGIPSYKRKKFVQMVIRSFEVAQIYGCHIDTAQEMLREVREKERELYPESKLRRHVSIKKFCAVHNEDEEDLRKHLAELHKEDNDEDDD
jgi:GGDEF domain-containing protein